MKNKIALTITVLGLALPAVNLNAQNGPRGPRGPRSEDGRPPVPPLVATLDLNHDGIIDASEINAAAESLRTLDKNNDGILTPDELHPGGGPRGQGAGPGPRGPRGPRPPQDDQAAPADQAGNPPAGRPPGPPIVAALDVNRDGEIDASELANAPAALKTLDKNQDGQLTLDEIGPRGPRGPRGRGPGRRPTPPQDQEQ